MNDHVKETAFCSFRKVIKSDLVERGNILCYSLGETVDRMKNDFGHDAFVLIMNLNTFFGRLEKYSCVGKSIQYGPISREYQRYMHHNNFPQSEMFQKDDAYAWQKEYRIILPPQKNKKSNIFLEIGSIKSFAFGGNIEDLRDGFGFSENAGEFTKL